MRKINKGPEPVKWKQYRKTPGVKYQSIPELRDSLLKEQGYIVHTVCGKFLIKIKIVQRIHV